MSHDLQGLLTQAVALIREKRIEEARALLDQALSLAPDNLDSLYLRARVEPQPARRAALLAQITAQNPTYRDAAAQLERAQQELWATSPPASSGVSPGASAQALVGAVPIPKRRLLLAGIALAVIVAVAAIAVLVASGARQAAPEAVVQDFFQALQKGDSEAASRLLGQQGKLLAAFCSGPIAECFAKAWPEIGQVHTFSTTLQSQTDVAATVLFRTHTVYRGAEGDICQLYGLGKDGGSWKIEYEQDSAGCSGLALAATLPGSPATAAASTRPALTASLDSTLLALGQTATGLALQQGPTLTATYMAAQHTQTALVAHQEALNTAIADTATARVADDQREATASQVALEAAATQTSVAQTALASTQRDASATQASSALLSSLRGHIAFTSGIEVNLLALPERSIQRLGNGAHAMWSPDGHLLVYEASSRLYIMNADGSGSHVVSPALKTQAIEPSWSPDGKFIAFAAGFTPQLWIVDVAGTAPHQLLKDSNREGSPAWSPDGRSIAYASCQASGCSIKLVDANGANARTLAPGLHPAWSPDGKRIAFECGDGVSDQGVCVMDADGANMRRLTDKRLHSSMPGWSPDGKFIAFASNRDNGWQLYAMTADGTSVVRLTDGMDNNNVLSWGP